MREDFQLRACSGKRVPKSCNVKGNNDNNVPIDIDSDELDDVVIIDAPDSLRQNFEGSSVLRRREKFPLRGIISIDDDETTNMDEPCIDMADCGGDLDSDASSSRSCHAAEYMWKSVDSTDDECQVVHEKKPAFNFSRCKQTYSRTAPSRNLQNHYGLNSESESGSSGSDCSDCELMEGSLGKLREQWEKASMRRKCNSGFEDEASPSGSHNGTNGNVAEDNRTPSVCSDSSNGNVQMGSASAFPATGNGDLAEVSFSPEMESVFVGTSQKLNGESYPGLRSDSTVRTPSSQCKQSAQYREETSNEYSHGGAAFYNKASYQQPSVWSYGGQRSDKEYNTKFWFMDKEKNAMGKMHADSQYTGVQNANASMCNGKCPSERHADHEKVLKRKDETPATIFRNIHLKESEQGTGFKGRGKRVSGGPLACDPQSSDGLHGKDGLYASMKKSKQGMPHLEEEQELLITPSTSAGNPYDDRGQLCIPTGATPSSAEGDIINDREKLKETDEYKRAVEEEWASRQRQLQIQAEEAQRLRKRRKAESMRVLDMARRQKERVEEMRETQKKDEEKMSLKEQFRVEVLKELNKLEMTCIDMASLLRGLGIHVGGGFHPLSNEVHAAYKRALLKFHPDRASRTDIRQQVEAEEKFKLVSRMKEKFLSTSCY